MELDEIKESILKGEFESMIVSSPVERKLVVFGTRTLVNRLRDKTPRVERQLKNGCELSDTIVVFWASDIHHDDKPEVLSCLIEYTSGKRYIADMSLERNLDMLAKVIQEARSRNIII